MDARLGRAVGGRTESMARVCLAASCGTVVPGCAPPSGGCRPAASPPPLSSVRMLRGRVRSLSSPPPPSLASSMSKGDCPVAAAWRQRSSACTGDRGARRHEGSASGHRTAAARTLYLWWNDSARWVRMARRASDSCRVCCACASTNSWYVPVKRWRGRKGRVSRLHRPVGEEGNGVVRLSRTATASTASSGPCAASPPRALSSRARAVAGPLGPIAPLLAGANDRAVTVGVCPRDAVLGRIALGSWLRATVCAPAASVSKRSTRLRRESGRSGESSTLGAAGAGLARTAACTHLRSARG